MLEINIFPQKEVEINSGIPVLKSKCSSWFFFIYFNIVSIHSHCAGSWIKEENSLLLFSSPKFNRHSGAKEVNLFTWYTQQVLFVFICTHTNCSLWVNLVLLIVIWLYFLLKFLVNPPLKYCVNYRKQLIRNGDWCVVCRSVRYSCR